MPRRKKQPEDPGYLGANDAPVFLDARRRRTARLRRPGERPWADRFEKGSIEELKHARQLMAEWVIEYGEWLLPAFEFLDERVQRRESRASSLDRVRQLAGARA